MLKKPTTIEDQLSLLKQRGCIVEDDTFALSVLADINYYRLSAYFLPFRNGDSYAPGTRFNTIISIYEFDRRLRTLLLALMEGLETKLRTRIAYIHAHQYGALGYMDDRNFNSRHKSDKFTKHINDVIIKNRQSLIVRHHQEKYGGQFPIWVIIELFTFGMLSTFYSDMIRADQKYISRSLFYRSDAEIRSWLHCLTHLRNACAHHSRLYYTLFPARPASIDGLDRVMDHRLFDYLLIAKALCQGTSHWDAEFIPAFMAIMEKHNYICLKHIGFPTDWRDYMV